jgi:hypothetical protein
MRTHLRLAAFCLVAIAASAGCTRPESRNSVKSHPICDAIEAAHTLLSESNAAWGEPQQVLRTGNNWYRIECESSGQGTERAVLVNPANSHAEFPMRR